MVLERCLQQARRELDEKVFRAFELYALSEKPVEEVSKILGISQNAVYIAMPEHETDQRKNGSTHCDLCHKKEQHYRKSEAIDNAKVGVIPCAGHVLESASEDGSANLPGL